MQETYTYKGRRVILDAAELETGKYETILMLTSGKELAISTSSTAMEAIADFYAIRAAHLPDSERADGPKPLTGKYAALRDALAAALEAGRQAEKADPEDGGTCNFDAAALRLPRWNAAKVEQAAQEAGTSCFDWTLYGQRRFVFQPDSTAQANARSRNAEAMTASLRSQGYDAFDYCQMD
jgi:hypothetical protein